VSPICLRAARRAPAEEAGGDRAASEVIGSILMIGITVAMAVTLMVIVYDAVHADAGAFQASMSGSLHENQAGWGSGDETVRVTHQGGQGLPADALAVVVGVAGDEARYTAGGADELVHGSQDAFSGSGDDLSIGERWASPELTIPADTDVTIEVVDVSASDTVWSGSFRSGTSACETDTTSPSVTSWSQSPGDVTTSTTGDVTVTATVSDSCGVDTTVDPNLHYRVNDGSNPSFTDGGAMSLQSGTTWEGTIPDQTWSTHGGDTLEYKLVGMTDDSGNTGESSIQDDLIDSCPTDSNPPTVSSWSQSPANVTTSTSEDVTVTATLADDCAGVDTTNDPNLEYRINAGSDPAWNDTGDMTFQTGTTWQGTIPDPTWADHGHKTLEYRLVDMQDDKGNTGESAVQQDEIEDGDAGAYVQVPLSMDTGTAVNDAAARSADDGGAPATLTEEQTDEQSSTDEHYGSASSGTATTPANAEDEPDDTYATVDANGEAVTVTDFDTGSGDVVTVEIAVEGKHDGGKDVAQDDTITLSHDEGPTSERYDLDTTDQTEYLEITGDEASWSWSDLQNLDVTAACTCHDNRNDEKVFSIDALWLRVETSVKTYELQTDPLTFDPLQGTSPYTLELRYRTGGSEAFQVQVWDGSTWTAQSPNLDQASYTVFAEELTAGEVAAGPQIRILDTGTAQNTSGTLDLDYVRVVSS
jgi:flagellin-like protein